MLTRAAARAALLAHPRALPPSVSAISRRHGSSSSHHDEHHEEHDSSVYTQEGFFSPAWRNTFIFSALALAAWQFAPEPNDEAYLTRWLAAYKTPKEKWVEMNAKHTAQSQEAAETDQVFSAGVASPVHRLRFPQTLDQASPFNNGVGMTVDMSDVKGLVSRGRLVDCGRDVALSILLIVLPVALAVLPVGTSIPRDMFLFLLLANAVNAALPQVDYNRMGTVGLAGSFAGFDFFQNSSLSFDSSTSTLLSRTSEGALSAIGTTNNGGRISAGCALDDVFYFGGSFSSINSTSASNVASYRPSSSQLSALGSNGPNGEVDAIFCDTKNGKVWVGGKFTSPGVSVAVWDTKAGSWSQPPFVGVSGAQARVSSITTNSSQSSLFFAGSFVVPFQGNGSLSGNNNPNVPFSAGATPFSSSLVPVPLQKAETEGSPSTTDSQFSDVTKILCPGGADGPGNTWFAQDGTTAFITARAFSFITASGVRLGNTFLPNHGTSEFSVTTIPDNAVQTLKYLDPTTGQNVTCSDPCPLSSDSSLLYQDFLFSNPLPITGVQIKLSKFTGSGAGLHLMQILSSGAFASSADDSNGESCFAPSPSNATRTGDWQAKQANTDISGTIQTVLVSSVDVGTDPKSGPTFTWMPYVSASGSYEMTMMIPGCTNFQDCDSRTSVDVTVFPGNGISPSVTTIDQTNTEDQSKVIYSGPILPTTPDFVTTITMKLASSPVGSGQNGKYELVADRIVLSLTSAGTGASGGNGTLNGTTLGAKNSFGFLEWPLSASSGNNATTILPNTSITALDALGTELFNALGGSTSLNAGSSAISSVVHHPSGTIYVGGNLNISSGAKNVVSFANGAVSALGDNGVDGAVNALLLDGDTLYVGGSFQDTASRTTNGFLKNIGAYDTQTKKWSALGAGLNGAVTGLNIVDGKVEVIGNFTKISTSTSGDSGSDAPGLAVWDTRSSSWVNSGGFIVGQLSMITNGTDTTQYVAGNVAAFRQFGASGMVMIDNNNGKVHVSPLGSSLDTTSTSSTSTSARRKRSVPHLPRTSWMSHVMFPHSWSKRQSASPSPLPAPLPAPAPAVLAGAFWTNTTTNEEVVIIGGNFSYLPTGATFGSQKAQALAMYDKKTGSLRALQGNQINGTVRALFVEGNRLYVGGQFTLTEASNGFAVYDLASQQWDLSGIQALQAASGSTVVVRSISSSRSKPNNIIVAGSFARAGSLNCQAICSLDMSSKQWNSLGNGISGEVASVAYANNQDFLIAAGSIALSDDTPANVAQYTVSNNTWTALGSGSDIQGPISAVEVNGGNINSVFAAGKSNDGSSSFLVFYNGTKWTPLASTLQKDSVVSQLAMVPLQEDHSGNAIVEGNRMLMISGSLDDSSFGNASSVLYDGQSFIPYAVSTTSAGTAGFVAALFHSFIDFDFNHRRFLATGIVILISIAIAAGIVFLLALIGILWTLFSRRDKDDKLNKYDPQDDDDDSIHHRPSSLLEHVNAATRGTIVGTSPSPFAEKGEEKEVASEAHDHDPYGPDASNYVRAETPSDVMGGLGTEEASRPAHARYSFDGAGEGELPLTAGAEVEILDDRDHAWWYARDVRTGREGVVPAAYLY
ncbi:hypothetical protein V5O48_001682 [Marasmius crinis-equi]|uniref:SH3 domain-containing protein n=1 Tax=Marasmius crinis-equi TaxID=585013 RepID=A0ABR3FYG9_9AGAR